MRKKMNVGKYLAADIKHAILDYQTTLNNTSGPQEEGRKRRVKYLAADISSSILIRFGSDVDPRVATFM
jgi:hypothetical protein